MTPSLVLFFLGAATVLVLLYTATSTTTRSYEASWTLLGRRLQDALPPGTWWWHKDTDDVRFNKFNVNTPVDFLLLTRTDYPIRGAIATTLKHHSNAISVVVSGDPALDEFHPIHYVNAVGVGSPTMPSDVAFWDEFREIVDMQLGRESNVDPKSILELPHIWSDLDIHQVAEAVHDEYPGFHQVTLIEELWAQHVPLDHDILPFRSNSDFIGRNVMMAELNTWAIGTVAPTNFFLKWYYGRPRPEEIAWQIHTGELREGVPDDIVQAVLGMNLVSAASFTAYEEGCPRHPSWPAMHSAASSASFWLAVVLDLTPEQYCEALRVDYAVSLARSCAGVHYVSDNIAGLNLGQQILAKKLPDHLAQRYGSSRVTVQAKIDRLRFDWANFDSRDCSTSAG